MTTGPFAIDAVTYPERPIDAADDLDGDGKPNNRFGVIVGALFAAGEASREARAAIASRALVTSLMVEGDTVSWLEAGAEPTALRGSWSHTRTFTSERARTAAQPVIGTVRVVLFGQPIDLPLVGVEVELHPDGDGYTGAIHGAIKKDDVAARVLPEIHRAIERIIEAHPEAHGDMEKLLDLDHDGKVTLAEVQANPVVSRLVAPDVQLFDAQGAWAPNAQAATPDALSVGFTFHASPAPGGVSPPS